MIPKYPKSRGTLLPSGLFKAGRLIKIVVVVELAFVGGSYVIWKKLHGSRDFRRELYDRPMLRPALEGYYSILEYFGECHVKLADYIKIGKMSNLFGEGDRDAKISVLTDDFISNFNKMKSNMEKKLQDAKELGKDELPAHFDEINSDMQDMMKYFSDSTKFLPHFNVRMALDGAKLLEARIEQEQRELMPKKKFAFKTKTLPQAPEKDATDSSALPKAVDVELYDCGFKNLLNQKAEKLATEINGQDVGLYNSTNSTLYLYGHPSTVHCSKLQNCRIFTGPVATSIFVEECNECTFVVACQQLRVHNTTDSDFYLHVTSRGIIEDCRGLRFAPYNWSYEDIRSDFKTAGLDRENNWEQIDDFNWLSKDAPSPNWSVLKENERRHIWDEI